MVAPPLATTIVYTTATASPPTRVADCTAVLALLADAAPADPAAPGAIADPLFAALLERETGDAGAPEWFWQVGGGSVSLEELGLSPVDALTVPPGAS